MRKKILTLLILFVSFNKILLAQGDNNFVKDKHLDSLLRKYLIVHSNVIITDKNGQIVPLEKEYSNENIIITSRNLKTDSIIQDKKIVGVYSFKFASLTEKPYLYLQYQDKIEFIELDKNFDLQKTMKEIMMFLKKYDNQLTLEEKLKTIENTMEVIYYNKYPIKEY